MDEIFRQYLESLSLNLTTLPDKPEETPENTLKALWLKAAGNPVSVLRAQDMDLPELSSEELIKLEELIEQRIDKVPLAHLTERQSFMGLEMLTGPQALIPRKETEILARTALNLLEKLQNSSGDIFVIDVCTGAGNIALVLANFNEQIKVYAADLSEDAVELAKKNTSFLALDGQVSLFSGDLLEPFKNLKLEDSVDLLTCNPPYISSSKVPDMPEEISNFEPELAFDGGSFGINLIRRLIKDAAQYLRPNGYLAFEVGLGQGDVIKKQVEKSNLYKDIYTVNDDSGNSRVIVAKKKV